MSADPNESDDQKVRSKTALVLGLTFVLPIVIILVVVTYLRLK